MNDHASNQASVSNGATSTRGTKLTEVVVTALLAALLSGGGAYLLLSNRVSELEGKLDGFDHVAALSRIANLEGAVDKLDPDGISERVRMAIDTQLTRKINAKLADLVPPALEREAPDKVLAAIERTLPDRLADAVPKHVAQETKKQVLPIVNELVRKEVASATLQLDQRVTTLRSYIGVFAEVLYQSLWLTRTTNANIHDLAQDCFELDPGSEIFDRQIAANTIEYQNHATKQIEILAPVRTSLESSPPE